MDDATSEHDFSQADRLIRGRQRYSRRARRAGDVLNQLLARSGYGQRKSTEQMETHWLAVIEPRWRSKTTVGKLRQGVLEIYVGNSTTVQHLNFQKKRLLQKLQQRLPAGQVTDLRFRVNN